MTTKKPASKPAKSAKAVAASLQGTQLAVAAPGNLSIPEGFKVKRTLQMPSLVMKTAGEQRVLLFNSGLQVSAVANKKGEAPATVADVTDFQTGEIFKFLVPSVVESTFVQEFGTRGSELPHGTERLGHDDLRREIYADTDIVGKIFAIRNAGKREGKRHVDFEVVELEAPEIKKL